jgi:hypothetical protein
MQSQAEQAARSPASVDTETFRRGSQIFSIFGQIEAVAADLMVQRGLGQRIEVSDFPDAATCPDVHVNERGEQARFALLLPLQHVQQFENLIRELRS